MVDTMLLLAASVCSCLHKTFIKLSEDIDNGSAIVQLNFQSLGWQELSYRKQIARQLRTQYVDGTHRPKYYTVT